MLRTFNRHGNPTTYKGTSCSYDVENRLTAYGSALTCGYRGDGLRAWKQPNGGNKTYFLYDGEVLACELDSSGNVSAVPTFGPAGLVSRRSGSTTTYMHFDSQGGLSQTTDGSGNVVASYGWDAYGTALNGSAGVYGYGAQWGYYTDAETGLQLLTYRMYDPAVGRFVNRDPIGYSGGVNLYEYVGNGPTNAVDPSGLKAVWVETKVHRNPPHWLYGRYYVHAYIKFDGGGTRCAGKSYGLWRTYDPPGAAPPLKDMVHSPDPAEVADDPRRAHGSRSDASFEKALCDCIGMQKINVPGSHAGYPWNYWCGAWARDMWRCAQVAIGEMPPYSESILEYR